MNIKPLKSKTEVLSEGLTLTTYANAHYGMLHIRGMTLEGTHVDITLSTYHQLDVVREALARLYCASVAPYQDDLVSLCALPHGHEGCHKADRLVDGEFGHEWDNDGEEKWSNL